MSIYLLDYTALFCLVIFWVGYSFFARKKAKTTNCIARCLNQHRIHWMYEAIKKDIRVGEASLISNLERNIAFFASTTLLVIAGILTLFAKTEQVQEVLYSIPYAATSSAHMFQFKLGILAFIFVMSFFKFTWSMRQYGFLNVMIGAAPIDESGLNENLRAYARQMAVVHDQAAHSYNYGLRAYYFSIAVMCWFYHPLLSIFATIFVVYTLYNREFNSKAVKAITLAQHLLEKERAERFPDA
ncbi:DUF599 domain-containing protein [Colwellia sp. RE-S-Sl-9]